MFFVHDFYHGLFALSRNLICCFCCFFFVGLILLIVGIVSIGAAIADNRSVLVGKYNEAVDQWTESYRSDFAQQSSFYEATSKSNKTAFQPDVSADTLKDKNGGYKSYDAFKFVASTATSDNVTLDISSNKYALSDYLDKVSQKVLTKDELGCGEAFDQCTTSTRYTSNRASTTVSCKPLCTDICSNRQGVWDSTSKKCTITKYLSKVCLVLEKVNRDWRIYRNSFKDAGCYYASYDDDMKTDAFFPGLYSTSRPSSLSLELRSNKDPFYVADRLTNGLLNFGLTASQNAANGVTLLIIGSLFIGLPICCCMGAAKLIGASINGHSTYSVPPMFINQTYAAGPGKVNGGAPYPPNNSTPYPGGPAPGPYPPSQYGGAPYAPSAPQQSYQSYPPSQQSYPPPQQGFYPPPSQGQGYAQPGGYPPQPQPPYGAPY
jgi:hypothetical protein